MATLVAGCMAPKPLLLGRCSLYREERQGWRPGGVDRPMALDRRGDETAHEALLVKIRPQSPSGRPKSIPPRASQFGPVISRYFLAVLALVAGRPGSIHLLFGLANLTV